MAMVTHANGICAQCVKASKYAQTEIEPCSAAVHGGRSTLPLRLQVPSARSSEQRLHVRKRAMQRKLNKTTRITNSRKRREHCRRKKKALLEAAATACCRQRAAEAQPLHSSPLRHLSAPVPAS